MNSYANWRNFFQFRIKLINPVREGSDISLRSFKDKESPNIISYHKHWQAFSSSCQNITFSLFDKYSSIYQKWQHRHTWSCQHQEHSLNTSHCWEYTTRIDAVLKNTQNYCMHRNENISAILQSYVSNPTSSYQVILPLYIEYKQVENVVPRRIRSSIESVYTS